MPNPGRGNTPLLDTITPARGDVGGSLAFLHDGAGEQTRITRTTSEGSVARISHLGYGDDGRLRSLSTSTGSASTAVTYDGRSFLTVSELTSTGTTDFDRSEATYSSDGVLHRRRFVQQRTHVLEDGDEPTTTTTTVDESAYLFYFAGRPVAQLERTALTDTLLFLTTDHLGTVVLATDAAGASLWQGGLSPFGTPYTLFTPSGGDDDPPPGDGDGLMAKVTAASTSPQTAGVFLRFPGQWDDPTFTNVGLDEEVYYNLHRWYQPGVGGYTRPDPLGKGGDAHAYLYALANPLSFIDPAGEKSRVCCVDIPKDPTANCGEWNGDCGVDECVIQKAAAYPNPSQYNAVRGSNSNTFAGEIARACGLERPDGGWARGWNADPAKPKKGRKPIPSPCALP